MHIPDGLLDAKTWIGAAVVAAAGVTLVTRRVQRDLDPREVPRIAVMTAFIFAAQMINFPIIGGTSGHMIGGGLAAMAFGPAVGTVIMTAVVTIQALLFQDGGITALGANVLNMALVTTFSASLCHRLLSRLPGLPWAVSVFLAGLVSVLAASALGAIQLATSGVIPVSMGLPAMLFWHLFIGAGEGAITVAVLSYLRAGNPQLLKEATRHA